MRRMVESHSLMLVSWQKGISLRNFLRKVTFDAISTTDWFHSKLQTTRKGPFGLLRLTKIGCLDLLAGIGYSVISQMNTVRLYPQYSKTLELTEKHDKHIFYNLRLAVTVIFPVFSQQNTRRYIMLLKVITKGSLPKRQSSKAGRQLISRGLRALTRSTTWSLISKFIKNILFLQLIVRGLETKDDYWGRHGRQKVNNHCNNQKL